MTKWDWSYDMLVGVLGQREIFLTFVKDSVNLYWENSVKFKYWDINKMYGLRIRRYLNWWIIFIHISRIFNVFSRPVIVKQVPLQELQAVSGGRITLPCNITSPLSDDIVALVLWYKGDMKVPIYTLDARRGGLEKAKHFPSAKQGKRIHFDVHLKLPGLTIDPVRADDDGSWRCRVEYKRFRTLSHNYILKVVVPPRDVVILDDRGQRIEGTIGPVDEGSNVSLICEAEGGSPTPSVSWWRDSVLLDDSYHITTQGSVRNNMTLYKVRRSDLFASFTCQASNNNITVPTYNSVTLDLNLRPLDVRITNTQTFLSAGKTVMLECESSGSRPRAVITWWKGPDKVMTDNEVISDNGNLTLSTLTFIPVPEDNGKKFTCTAENPSLSNSLLEDFRIVTVHYTPLLRLTLGASIKHTSIKEGSDVYFDCNIRANPWVHDVGWLFDDKPLHGNVSAGIIISNQSLVLQRVTKKHRGRYQCFAINSEGEGRSEEVRLNVQFAPVCKQQPNTVYGVGKSEVLNITCEVEADPTDIKFQWTLNNSVESINVKNYVNEGTSSTVYYTPGNMLGYGSLLCWPSNNIGRAAEPCIYKVVPVAEEDEPVLSPMIGMLIGVASALLILFIVITIIVRLKTRRRRKGPDEVKPEKCELPIQNYKEESIDSTIESPDVIPADSQIYAPDEKRHHLECTRLMNEEMYKILKQKQDNYEALVPITEQSHAEMVDDLSYRDYQKHPIHMDPPTEYADVLRGHTQVLPLPVSDALDRRAPELPLIHNMQQQSSRDCIHGDRIVATTPL